MARMKNTLVRKDNLGRILNRNEYQRKDGRYMFTYTENGRKLCAYSMRLKASDPVPPGGSTELSLREKEEKIRHDLYEGTPTRPARMTVAELIKQYTDRKKPGVRMKTRENYDYILRKVEGTSLGTMKISDVSVSVAKDWCVMMQQSGCKYNTIRVFLGVLKPAFESALEEGKIRRNPFQFKLSEVIPNNSGKREPLTKEEVETLLEFAKNDACVSKYADALAAMLESGVRVAEFCGITVGDIDFENNVLYVSRQLVRDRSGNYRIVEPKTGSGKRAVPMTPKLREVLTRLVENRETPEEEPEVNGVKGFLFFNRKGMPFVSCHWQSRFATIRKRYYKETAKTLKLSPHVCRHTFCTFMVLRGMNLKVLQYIMGHASISVTLDTYTHLRVDEAKAEVARLEAKGLLG